MDPVIVVGGARVFAGDCREALKHLPDNSVDSVVTDPPYELGFMGKSWDSTGIAYDPAVWAECLRVLKPGGHILAFGGSRTWHRLAVAVEDAGFEIRDNIAWIYGNGFPKSLDVSKAIDKSDAKVERRARDLRFTAWMRSTGITAKKINNLTGSNMGSHYLTDKEQPTVPTEDMFALLRPYLPDVPKDIERLVFDRTVESKNFAEREVTGEHRASAPHQVWMENYSDHVALPPKEKKDKALTPEAQQWEGWGTALKPAHEPIVVGRKPLIGTVAENVLAWGVGGLNIDGSRIGTMVQGHRTNGKSNEVYGDLSYTAGERWEGSGQGRWPANVILDEVTAGLLDEQSGITKSGGSSPSANRTAPNGSGLTMGHMMPKLNTNHLPSEGGASRFFYVAKASKRDRNEGLEELEQKAAGSLNMRTDEHSVRNGMNTGARSNFHPTVKPTALMRYLIKLVTPPGGTVLDPFTGSGSTGKAALLDGFQFVGVELTEEYLPIIEGRLRWASEQVEDDGTLF
jgi:DNA modification methylase